jgi:CheY-like chemotaxis protein
MTAKINVPIEDRNLTRKAILLVEDDSTDEELTLRALRQSNIMNEVVVARNGEEALNYLFAFSRSVDRDDLLPALVLLDLKLPMIDGMEVLRQIRMHPHTKDLPVVVLTGSNAEQDMQQAQRLAVRSYIHKPIDFEKFAEAVSGLGMHWVLSGENRPEVSVQ